MTSIFLFGSILFLMMIVKRMKMIERTKPTTYWEEIVQYGRFTVCGICIISLLLFISYNVWTLAGRSVDWDGMYILALSFLSSVIGLFLYYGKRT